MAKSDHEQRSGEQRPQKKARDAHGRMNRPHDKRHSRHNREAETDQKPKTQADRVDRSALARLGLKPVHRRRVPMVERAGRGASLCGPRAGLSV